MKKVTVSDYVRMCKSQEDCTRCPIAKTISTCHLFIEKHPDKANEIVLKWCEEHPIKTRQSEFLKMFPNAKIDNCGTSTLCPQWVDKDFECNLQILCCDECCREYWLAEVEE